jgi:nucleoside-diphosphate-sugar epimerase
MSETAPTQSLHVVLGAGQVGVQLADILLGRGHRVRVVRRGEGGTARPGLEWRRADLADADAAAAACAGASVLYDCTNPANYGSWDRTLIPLRRGVLAAARRTGAFLVSLDNLYVYGRPDGPLREELPMRPCSRKGELRARLVGELLDAHARGELRATVARASDFFGPGAAAMALYGDRFVRGLARGRAAIALGDPDLPRSYSYVPDVAAGLAVLGAHPGRAAGEVFHLPVAWKDGSTREFVARFAAELGARPRMMRIPRWFFRAAGLFSRQLGAMAEMIYQWETPYVVDDSRFTEAFAVRATPIEVAVRDTVRAAGLAPLATAIQTG